MKINNQYLSVFQNFEKNLKSNPELLASSVNVYLQTIRELIDKYGIDPSVEQLNEFIAYKTRRRQPGAKYAIKHYLKFRWREELYYKLVRAKIRTPKVRKTFLNKQTAMNIIKIIDDKKHRLIAKIQYFTGARASEIIPIRKTQVKKEAEYNRIKIDITGKGQKPRPIYLEDSIFYELIELSHNVDLYLFLKEKQLITNEEVLTTKTHSYYKRYYESLKQAAKDHDIDMGTHDWRRSFANSLRKEKVDIVDIKKALGHSRIETTERYFENDPESIAETMLKHQKAI